MLQQSLKMVKLTLAKKDTNIKRDHTIKITDVLLEVRSNHNEIVDALMILSSAIDEITEQMKKVPDLEKSIEFNAESIVDLKDKIIPDLLKKANENTNNAKQELAIKICENEEKIVKAEGHSRRKNIILNGKVKGDGVEVTETVAREFLIQDLKMEKDDVDKMIFRDVHRLPKSKKREGPEPIIMAFVMQKDRNSVIRKAYELKGTNLSLKTDLPKTINEHRGRMLTERSRLLTENPGVKYRVTERSYLPVLQKGVGVWPGTASSIIKWDDIK